MPETKPPKELGERAIQAIADAIAEIKAMPGYREPPKRFVLFDDWTAKQFEVPRHAYPIRQPD